MNIRGKGRSEANSPSLQTHPKCQNLGHVPRLTPTWKKERGASQGQLLPNQATPSRNHPEMEGWGQSAHRVGLACRVQSRDRQAWEGLAVLTLLTELAACAAPCTLAAHLDSGVGMSLLDQLPHSLHGIHQSPCEQGNSGPGHQDPIPSSVPLLCPESASRPHSGCLVP